METGSDSEMEEEDLDLSIYSIIVLRGKILTRKTSKLEEGVVALSVRTKPRYGYFTIFSIDIS